MPLAEELTKQLNMLVYIIRVHLQDVDTIITSHLMCQRLEVHIYSKLVFVNVKIVARKSTPHCLLEQSSFSQHEKGAKVFLLHTLLLWFHQGNEPNSCF